MKNLLLLSTTLMMIGACTTNPLLKESGLEYGAPEFDRIKAEDYLPAFEKAIEEAKAEVTAIIDNPQAPTFDNTIVALEQSGKTLARVSGLFYNILEANASDVLQQTAEAVAPKLNEYTMFVSLSQPLFDRVKEVYDHKDELNLAPDQTKLLENTYDDFVRGGALLNAQDKETFSRLSEELSLATLKFSKNALDATNAFSLNITDKDRLSGIPDYLMDQAAELAQSKGQSGWTFDLSAPMYTGIVKYADDRELRKTLSIAYGSRAFGGEYNNCPVVLQIADLRLQIAKLLGYNTYAEYALQERMVKTPKQVYEFLAQLTEPTLPAAKEEVRTITAYAKKHGFADKELKGWDFSYWSEKYKQEFYAFSENELKPYFELDSCVRAVFGLAGKLYGLNFAERKDIPVYQEDVKVYDVKDENGRHMALLYMDFFPRASKRAGAWMTEFRGQSIVDGIESRPLISLVTNFTKPTANAPALITHDELCTLLHEFGHCLNGILAEGRYASLCSTNVATDFVEMASQIMENWAYEPEFLNGFAKHYKTGEVIPMELIDKVKAAKNFNAAYFQIRQLSFGYLDMAWNAQSVMTTEDVATHEQKAIAPVAVLPHTPGTCMSTSFTHIFTGQYAAGYYAYKWSEVLAADGFSLFKEKGIFNREVAQSYRDNVLSRGGQDDYGEMFRKFRGHDPQVSALLESLGITAR